MGGAHQRRCGDGVGQQVPDVLFVGDSGQGMGLGDDTERVKRLQGNVFLDYHPQIVSLHFLERTHALI